MNWSREGLKFSGHVGPWNICALHHAVNKGTSNFCHRHVKSSTSFFGYSFACALFQFFSNHADLIFIICHSKHSKSVFNAHFWTWYVDIVIAATLRSSLSAFLQRYHKWP